MIGIETGWYKPHQEEPKNSETRKLTASSIIAYLSIVFLFYKFFFDPKSIPFGMAGTMTKYVNLTPDEANFTDGMRAIAEIKAHNLI